MARNGAVTERYVVEHLAALRPTDTVLVIGPGPGVGLLAAAACTPQGSVIGVEPSAVIRRAAARRCARAIEAGRVELRDGTAEHTGRPSGSVDVVISVNNLQLWPHRATAFAELRRVLRPGGRLVVSLPDQAMPSRREELRKQAADAGYTETRISARRRPGDSIGSAIELTARRPDASRVSARPSWPKIR